MSNKTMKRLGHRTGLTAMAVAALTLSVPTNAFAQDRGPSVSETRRGPDGGAFERYRNMRREQAARMPDAGDSVRSQQVPQTQVERPGARADWQISRDAYRNRPAQERTSQPWRQQQPNSQQAEGNPGRDSRTVEQWRTRDGDRWNNQNAYRDGARDGRNVAQWRDRRDDRNRWQVGRDGQNWQRDAWRDGRRDNRQWDRGWRSNSHYDWSTYRARNRSIYSPGRYYAPQASYRYSRIGIGFRLGTPFFGSRYWINDPWSYRLPDVYGPYRWVRYYDDVVLVDTFTGQVVDVIYDFFW